MLTSNKKEFLDSLFFLPYFIQRSSERRWSEELIVLHNASDVMMSLSCLTVAIILTYLIRRRSDFSFSSTAWLFGTFGITCGLTHILDIVAFYTSVPRLVESVRLWIGSISAATVVLLIRTIQRSLSIRSYQTLERELEERRRSEAVATIRIVQLEALVELSRRCLDAVDVDAMSAAVAIHAARGLDVGRCGVFIGTPDGEQLQLRGGVGWPDGLVGVVTVPARIEPLVSFVAREAHLDTADLAQDGGCLDLEVGAVGVVSFQADGPHGILVAYTTKRPTLFLVAQAPRRKFSDEEASFFCSVSSLLGSNLERIEAERALTRLATTDELTGLRNARHFREVLTASVPHTSRAADVRSVIMLDVDHFKSYNDTFGHPAGDEVLCQVGAILRGEARAHDMVARYGGEEFAMVLPGTGAQEARAFAERVRLAISSHPWKVRRVTASLGVASGGSGGTGGISGMGLLGEADQALYLAKRTGRDRVVHHDDLKESWDATSWQGGSESSPGPPGSVPTGASLLQIDDDSDYCRMLERQLGSSGLAVVAAPSAAEGLVKALEGHDLILLDVRLPDGNGLDLCRRLKADPATAMIPILLLSGTLIKGEDRARALTAGASAALSKLTDPEELLAVISALLRASQIERELIRERLAMGERLREQAAELGRICDSTIEGWARALELRDHETEGHSRRVAELATRIARKMGLDEHEIVPLRRGALLHDIGKVGVPDAILNKPGLLNEMERAVLRRHPEVGYRLLHPIEFLQDALDIPLCHHERWDGSGYPNGLRGEQIPVTARIFAAADIHDALSFDRPYRNAWDADRVREHMRSLAGTHLDPAVVEAILAIT